MIDDFFGFLREVTEGLKLLEIPVRDESGSLKGNLVPITKKNIDSTDAVRLLTEWRNRYRDKFFTQFVATESRTRNWLENVVFQNPGQMLFLVYEDEKLIGHIGIKNLEGRRILLDNLLKCEQSIDPLLIEYVIKAMSSWLFDASNTDRVYGQVFSDNISAIMLNRKLGWKGWVKIPMIKTEDGNGIVWVLGTPGEKSQDAKYIYEIYFERNAFGAS